jgi:hypothetical protein
MTTGPWASVEDVARHLGVARDSEVDECVRAGGADAHNDGAGKGEAR